MARTAIVNPRRKRRKSTTKRRRRRNPSTAIAAPRTPNRRRRTVRRRRNPSTYQATGYRKPNPGSGDMFDLDRVMDVMPPATAGIWGVRFALKQAGAFEPMAAGKGSAPGIKHAIAAVIGADVAAKLVASAFGADKAQIAYAAAIGFAGDVFARKRFFVGSEFVNSNLYLQGIDDMEEEAVDSDSDSEYYEEPSEYPEYMEGLQQGSSLGAQIVQGPDGQLYTLQGLEAESQLAGLQDQSALGRARSSRESSFGYA